MKITYMEGSSVSLAEVNKITLSGNMLICQLASLDSDGKPETVIRPFPDAQTCEDFFREVIVKNPDKVVNLEQTNFDPRLAQLFADWDALEEGL